MELGFPKGWWAPCYMAWSGAAESPGTERTGIQTIHAMSHQVAPGPHLLPAAERGGAGVPLRAGWWHRVLLRGEGTGSQHHFLGQGDVKEESFVLSACLLGLWGTWVDTSSTW